MSNFTDKFIKDAVLEALTKDWLKIEQEISNLRKKQTEIEKNLLKQAKLDMLKNDNGVINISGNLYISIRTPGLTVAYLRLQIMDLFYEMQKLEEQEYNKTKNTSEIIFFTKGGNNE